MPTSNTVSLRDVYDIVARTETKVDNRMAELDLKVDLLASRVDRLEGRLEGSVGMLKWLGPTGLVAVVFGIARLTGIV